MIIRLDKARVTSPTQQADKALATITVNDDGTADLEVTDRRTGETLMKTTGLFTELDRTAWRVGDWSVERQQGCGCGGTTLRAL